MPVEHDFYRDNLEQVLASTGGRQLLNIADVRHFTGLVDCRTIRRLYPIDKDGHISAPTFARCLCKGAGATRVRNA